MSDAYVVDTSALIQALVADRFSSHAKSMLGHLYDEDPSQIHIVDFSIAECLNILWKRIRFYGLALEDAKVAALSLLGLPLVVHAPVMFHARALEIGLTYQLPVYDTMSTALAEQLALEIVTDDDRQAKVAVQIGIVTKPLTSFV